MLYNSLFEKANDFIESMTRKTILVTGGAGFIGVNLIRYLMKETPHQIVNVDKLTYASQLEALKSVSKDERYFFEQVNIGNRQEIARIFSTFKPDAVMHLAAESHVDRSIDAPSIFMQTNVLGTSVLLEECTHYWQGLAKEQQQHFRFLHVSTDEVYGELKENEVPWTEDALIKPSSPYAASKAASDHLVNAWHRTYGLPTIISRCTNNFGEYQHCEKLIPKVITNALQGNIIPIYGDGKQKRDWIYVKDHVKTLYQLLEKGKVGKVYHIGVNNEKTNFEIIEMICIKLNQFVHNKKIEDYRNLISFVKDRLGHDKRYSLNTEKIKTELFIEIDNNFEKNINQTIEYYINKQ